MLNKYSKILKKELIFSSDLEIDNMKKEMEMYINLIQKNFLDTEISPFENPTEFFNETNNIKLITKSNKLRIYLNDILNLEKQTELKLLALEKILKEDKLSIRQRHAIENKIINLTTTIYVFKSQKEAISIEVKACINEYKNNITEVNQNIMNNVLKDKKTILLKKLEYINPKKLEDYIKNYKFTSIYNEITYLEYILELEVYKNHPKLKKLLKDIHDFDIKKTKSLKDHDKFKEFNKLELGLTIFYEYGKNLVTIEMIEELYNLKFSIIKENLYDKSFRFFEDYYKNLNYAEMEFYEKIIMSRINSILMGNNKVLTISLKEYNHLGIKLIAKILKNENNEYSFYDILNDHQKLTFLLSFDNITEKDFFSNYYVNRKDYNLDYEENIFLWTDYIPLETICRIAICENKTQENLYYEFFKLKIKSEEYQRFAFGYRMPEGIKSIFIKDKNTESKILDAIRKESKRGVVFTPSTLITIDGDLFEGTQVKELYLNEGLEKLDNFPASHYNIEKLVIPSTLDSIAYFRDTTNNLLFHITYIQYYATIVEKYRSIKNLVFDNFKNFDDLKFTLEYLLPFFYSVDYSCNIEDSIYKVTTDSLKTLEIQSFGEMNISVSLTCSEIQEDFYIFRNETESSKLSTILSKEEVKQFSNHIIEKLKEKYNSYQTIKILK